MSTDTEGGSGHTPAEWQFRTHYPESDTYGDWIRIHADQVEYFRGRNYEIRALFTAPPDNTVPEGGWLWGQFMDLCRNRGLPPASQNDLFAIAKRAHELNLKGSKNDAG